MLGPSQRAFFCGDAKKLSQVISSPFGFGAAFEGHVLLFALELRHAERLLSADGFNASSWTTGPSKRTGRTLLADIALGRCHTAQYPLQEVLASARSGQGGAVPMVATLEAEYRAGADSVYFPRSGIIALLSPNRALPMFLAEYRQQRVGHSSS